MEDSSGRAPSGTGSRPSDQARTGLDAPRVDPSLEDYSFAYPDCFACAGRGYRLICVDGDAQTRAYCGNCRERRDNEGLLIEPQNKWAVWTKKGRAPSFFHTRQEVAEREAKRLARKHPGRKFLVMQITTKIGVAPCA